MQAAPVAARLKQIQLCVALCHALHRVFSLFSETHSMSYNVQVVSNFTKKKDFYVNDVVVAHEDQVEDVAVKVGVEVWSTLRFDCGLFVTRQLLWDSRATKPAKITGLTMDLKWPWESLASLQKIYNFLSLLYWDKTSLQIFSVHTFVVFSMFGLLNCFVWVTNMIIDKICLQL